MKIHIEQSQLIKASQEEAFKAWTDYEAWPKFSPLFTRASVKERRGNTALLDIEANVMGRKSRRTEKHVLIPPEKVRVEGETEGTANTTVWKFEPTAEGTRLTAILDAQLKGVLLTLFGPFARRKIKSLLSEWMTGLAKYAEEK